MKLKKFKMAKKAPFLTRRENSVNDFAFFQ
jgi:hypothetical protein